MEGKIIKKEDIEIIINNIELSAEQEKEFSNGKGEQEDE